MFSFKPFPYYAQLNAMDCGPTCLRMISKHYGRHFKANTLRKITGFNKQGVSLLGISEAAEKIGFQTKGVKLSFEQLYRIYLPCILHWDDNHFVVLIKADNHSVKLADPGKGIVSYNKKDFLYYWTGFKNDEIEKPGLALLLTPTMEFYKNKNESDEKIGWGNVLRYLKNSKRQITSVLFALLISSVLQLIIPYLTQSIIDVGISNNDLNFIVLILIAQLMVTFSQTIVGFIRNSLLLRISNMLNIQILSDFWIKLTRLPVSYFEARQTGDTLQRINDHNTIQDFLTGTALNTLFSILSFLIYSIILIIYNLKLFLVFLLGSILYFIWVQLFLKIRRKINYKMFHLSSKENNATLQLIQGMQEIRLNNAEKEKRWEWEDIQALIFKLNIKNLNYTQWQTIGANFINQVQNIIISFIVARLVISGDLTLGTMLAVQYIVGQLNGPISQWISFIQGAQDAKIGMERLNEIHDLDVEENPKKNYLTDLSEGKSIMIEKLSFSYPGAYSEPVLKDINLFIPEGKITAIVGSSGSGKTTLLKILLKIYDQFEGKISVGSFKNSEEEVSKENAIEFRDISFSYWRQSFGAVMQDGYIFNDNILKNITIGQTTIDEKKVISSCETSNIMSFISSLPKGFETQLGAEGIGLSQGQKQRLLIARSVYKDPHYLFFDEATNALDTKNEKEIVRNMDRFFKGKTVVIIAHRLSTIKKADNIVVLHHGKIAEQGTHENLITEKGIYFDLIKDQLDLMA